MSWECSSCGFTNNDDSIESCMCGFTNPAYPTSATKTVEDDSVIVLRRKASKEWIGGALALWLMLIMYGLLGAVIPVVWNGDLNAVLPTDTRTFRNGMIFSGALSCWRRLQPCFEFSLRWVNYISIGTNLKFILTYFIEN
jgi:hypothetical protein